jgi:hypothetical protein
MNGADQEVRLPRAWRVAALAFAVAFGFAGAGLAALVFFAGVWPVGVLTSLFVVLVAWLAVRTSRIRLQLVGERMVVANQMHNTSLARTEVRGFEVGPSANPLGTYRTVVATTVDGREVRIEALAVPAAQEDALDPALDALERWLFRRR